LTNNTTESFSLVVVRFVCWGNVWIRSTYSFLSFLSYTAYVHSVSMLFFSSSQKMCIL
jgi:hypothetical protein